MFLPAESPWGCKESDTTGVTEHKGEKNVKQKRHVCVTESLCFIPETNTTLYINYTSIQILKIGIIMAPSM